MLGLVGGDEVLRVLGELGVILLLLEVGLEMDLGELGAVGRASLLVARRRRGASRSPRATALASVLGQSGNAALFVGAALTATSVGITARVFGDLRALATVEARTVLGAAVADDVIGLVILTVVVRIVDGGQRLDRSRVARHRRASRSASSSSPASRASGWRRRCSQFVHRGPRSPGTLVALALAFTLALRRAGRRGQAGADRRRVRRRPGARPQRTGRARSGAS